MYKYPQIASFRALNFEHVHNSKKNILGKLSFKIWWKTTTQNWTIHILAYSEPLSFPPLLPHEVSENNSKRQIHEFIQFNT